jgi:hypothetical protein
MKKTILLVFGLLIYSSSNAQLFSPSNYEDCVLQGIKDAKTDAAVVSLQTMCDRKFSSKKFSGEKSNLRKLSEGNLICESGVTGYLPFEIFFNRKTNDFFLNGYKGKIHTQTEDKIFSKLDGDDIGTLNLSLKTFELSNKTTTIRMTCELNKKIK